MEQEIGQKIAKVVKNLFDAQLRVELTRPDEQFGDYATNVALQLGNKLGKSPREVGEKLAEKLKAELADNVVEVSVAGPGFMNLKLSDEALLKSLNTKPTESLKGKTVVVEYSDPNPFKPLHAGHLYTTLVGDMIARLVENAGAKTIRINYGGDVGLHVAKTIWAIVGHFTKYKFDDENFALYQIKSLADKPLHTKAAFLGARYAAGNTAYESKDEYKTEIIDFNKRIYNLHLENDHESDLAQIYWTCRQWSYDYFAELYRQLKVKPFDRFIPESEVTPLGVETVQKQLENGVFKKSDGAVVFAGEEFDLHTRVFINSEGLPTYETKDVGLSLTKWKDYKFDKSIIITANEQAQYMQVVLAAIKQFAPEPAERTRHLTHGVVKLQGGVKMSSRRGNVVTAMEILEAAHQAAADSGRETTEDTVLAAVKYAFAKARLGGDIIYDPAESIALEGNSGPYIQYAHARARSILVKSAKSPSVKGQTFENSTVLNGGLEKDERSLARKLSEYAEAVERATGELMPHHICTYLYELAQTFNSFYEHNRVIGDERQKARLHLVDRYAETLKNGLALLGISAPDKM